MSNIVKQTVNKIVEYSKEQVDLIKRTLLDTDKVTYSQDELSLFINQCKRTGLDPFTRQIYATKTKGKMTVQATIDGLRLIAERSGNYAGQTRPTFFDHDGNEFKVWPNKKGLPYACEVGVLRHDFKEPVYAMAIFDEYAQKTYDGKLGFMWQKMPSLMLSKVAEALALRRAFPNDLSGIYGEEEISVIEPKEVTQKEQDKPKEIINHAPQSKAEAELDYTTFRFDKGPFVGKTFSECDQIELAQKMKETSEIYATMSNPDPRIMRIFEMYNEYRKNLK